MNANGIDALEDLPKDFMIALLAKHGLQFGNLIVASRITMLS